LLYKFRLIALIFFQVFVARSYSQTPKIDSLKTIVEKYKATVPAYKKDTVYINHLMKLGYGFRYIKLDSMLYYAKTAKKLSTNIDYTYGILTSNREIGNYYILIGDYAKAKEIHLKNLEASKKVKYHRLVSDTYNAITFINVRNNNYPLAYKNSLEALDYAKAQNDYEYVVLLNLNIGVMFSLLKDFETSLTYFKDCLENKKIVRSPSDLGTIYANIGYSYLHLEQYKKGLENLNKALKICKKNEFPRIIAFTYVTFGHIFLKQQKLDKALTYFKLAEEKHNNIEDKKGSIDMNLGLANTYLLLQKKDLAAAYANKASLQAKELNYLDGMLGAAEIQYKLSKANKNWKNSLVHLEQVHKIADSLATEKNRNILLMEQARINYQKEKENIKQLAENKIAKQRWFVIASLIALLIAILAIILIFRSNRRANNLNKKLANQTVRLSENQSNLNQINANQEKLFSIVGHDLRGPIISLRELMALSLENNSNDHYFKRFAPKLKKDLDHIHFMLDNLLNWGQTQMRGAILNPEIVDVKKEIDRVYELFEKRHNYHRLCRR